ncbi:MAG: non-canonical purine NTP pyrophosphatase [Candidatus Dormibacteraeota bacterium]|nr:non-canonical purine NTP pyrophosphatase [Candidatus Dormibacteraeota bacterium]
MRQLLLATKNSGKLAELRALLADLPMELLSPADAGIRLEVEEDGATYAANARKKAEAGMRASKLPTLGDDSGLEVAVLDGQPGVRSARFAGPDKKGQSDALMRAVLDALGKRAGESPAAVYRCVAVMVLPDGRSFEGEGILAGTIAAEPRGRGGFGYDPIFQLADGRRMAEMTIEEKNLLSHRARALNALEVHGAFDAAMTC